MFRTSRLALPALLLLLAGCGANVVTPVYDGPPRAATGSSSSGSTSASGTTGTSSSSTGSSGSSGSTGGVIGDDTLCSPCQVDTDCGEEGLATCEVQLDGVGFCLPSCASDSDCDLAAVCQSRNGQSVCVPSSGTCIGFVPGGPRPPPDSSSGSGSTSSSGSTGTSSTSGSTSTSTSGTTTSGTSTTGGTTTSGTTTTGGTTTSGTTTTGGTTSGSTTTGGTTGTGVTLNGGTVDRMHFLITGDTRPPQCEDTADYPTAVIKNIADAATANNVQFALDMGDHMFVCNNDTHPANAQMNLYMNAISRFAGPWFMTEGNHECMAGGSNGHCPLTSTNANYLAFMNALSPVASKPYYKRDIQTSQGLARFVFVADNSWTSAQETWLKNTLTDADAHAKYTIIVKHHPAADTSVSANATIMSIVRAHKFALLLTGHAHHYSHPSSDNGREIVLGIGGAPLTGSATYHGYAIVDQRLNGNLRVTVYSLATGAAQDSWAVGPN